MKIGIIVYSHTGNTLSVGKKLKDAFQISGHAAVMEQVTGVNEDPSSREPIQLKYSPDIAQYDVIVFGAPVHGFSLSRIMKFYLNQIPQLNGKKVMCFLTEHFPKPWMGGNQAMGQMEKAVRSKDGAIAERGIVNWTGKQKEHQIADIVDRFVKAVVIRNEG